VTDPRRFPLSVLARLPRFLPAGLGNLELWKVHREVCCALALTTERVEAGPVCVRAALRVRSPSPDRLAALQAELSERVWLALVDDLLEQGGAPALLNGVTREFARLGVAIPH
jgi:hypothetical protein